MANGLTYLITGANRGIGLGLTRALLQRPHTTVVACVRDLLDVSVADLKASPNHPTSTLVTLPLDSTSDSAFAKLPLALKAHSIRTIDVLIANAGSSSGYAPIVTTPLVAVRSDFETNTLGPIKLFQACNDLLKASETGNPKFILVSSVLGSIGALGAEAGPALAYGVSKAGANFFVRKLHFECEDIVALAIHPGWVKTNMGQGFANAVGVEAPPMELDSCVGGLLEQIDAASRGTTSGSFISYDGKPLPW